MMMDELVYADYDYDVGGGDIEYADYYDVSYFSFFFCLFFHR